MAYKDCRSWENIERMRFPGAGVYDIPQLSPVRFSGECAFIPFSDAARRDGPGLGVHFFIDDYRFSRVWSAPDRYRRLLARFDWVLSPDFSMYTDFSRAIQIYNHFRKHWVGAYWQAAGIRVIPSISWSTPDSYAWCFDGDPVGGTVAVSSVGTQANAESKALFLSGYLEMVRRLQPESILFYGGVPKECTGNIVRIRAFTDKFKHAICEG